MSHREFLEYLEQNLDAYQTFMKKATLYQESNNKKRQPSKRWSSEKMQKAAYEMWKASMQNLYNTLKNELKSDDAEEWIEYIEKNSILETVNEGISDLDFSDDM